MGEIMTQNVTIVRLNDGREVCLSYGVIVAAFIPADLGTEHKGYVRTTERYSVTTSRHMNAFAGKNAPEVPDAVLRALVAPVTDRRTT
jgi:hypothetical protein